MATVARLPRRTSRGPLVIVGAAVLVAAATYAAAWAGGRFETPRVADPATQQAPSTDDLEVAPPGGGVLAEGDLARIDQAIGVWSGNLERDPADFISATNLASLYLERGRLTGDAADYDRGLAAIDQALEAYPESIGSRAVRAQLLFTTHDFVAARDEASAILAIAPDNLQALATLGDAALELGDYGAAAIAYADLDDEVAGPAVIVRHAHLAWLRGAADDARRLAAEAQATAETDGLSAAERAWYAAFAGEISLRTGDRPAAEARYREATLLQPTSHQAHAGLARALAAGGDLPGAIAAYEAANAIVPEPANLAALGDLYALTGRDDLAEQHYRAVEATADLAAASGGVYGRQLVLFWADHRRSVERALEAATAELASRRDVYGWDGYAWALLANGQAAEADAAMTTALAVGTSDATLDYHAGIIAAAVSDPERGRRHLEAALATDTLAPLDAQRARAMLESLRP